MRKRLIIIPLLMIACENESGKRYNEGDAPEALNQPPPVMVVQSEGSEIFLNTSSELRCDALHNFFENFAHKVLDDGKVDQFSCEDLSTVNDKYFVTLRLASGEKFSYIEKILAVDSKSPLKYCDAPYSANRQRICDDRSVYFLGAGERVGVHEGVIHKDVQLLDDLTEAYVNQPQSQDLAFGMDAVEFAKSWIGKLNAGESYSVKDVNGTTELWFSINPEKDDSTKGLAKITRVSSSVFDSGRSFFGCEDADCLTKDEYSYIFNGHLFVLGKKSKDAGGLRLSVAMGLP